MSRFPSFLLTLVCALAGAGVAGAAASELQADPGRLWLGGRAFDPREGFPGPAELGLDRYAGDVAGLHLIQFEAPPGAAERRALEQLGLTVVAPVPRSGLLVFGPGSRVDAASRAGLRVRFAGMLPPAARKAPDLGLDEEAVEVVVQTLRRAERGRVPPRVAARGEVASRMDIGPYTNVRLRSTGPDLRELLFDPEVVAMHRWVEPRRRDERQLQIVAGNHDGNAPSGPGYASWLASYGLGDLSSVLVDVCDDGIDGGDPGNAAENHPDLFGRIAYVKDWTSDRNSVFCNLCGVNCGGHGTLNAGIVMGDGTAGALTDAGGFLHGGGVASGARVGGSKIFSCAGLFSIGGAANGFASIVEYAWGQGARISSNSWGTSNAGAYDSDSQAYDFLVRDADDVSANGLQEMSILFSAGNAGPTARSVGSPATAKNVIAVGASENVRATGTDGCGVSDASANALADLVSFSSRGPTSDGRLKPDLVAPGSHVINAAAQNPRYDGSGVCNAYFPAGQTLYAMSSGTSHSTPAVAGAAAVVFHDWHTRSGQAPSPALVKASLLASAVDMVGGNDGGSGTLGHAPDVRQGFGRLDLGVWLDAASVFAADQAQLLSGTGEWWSFGGLRVADPSRPMRIVLVWTDVPGVVNSGALVNDLDLEVEAAGSHYLGNVFGSGLSATGGMADSVNNVEAVFLAGSTPGPVAVRVRASALLGDAVPGNSSPVDQDFALVALNATREPREGAIGLDRPSYRCPQVVEILLEDADLAGAGSAAVAIASGREVVAEVLTLLETGASTGVFRGQIALADAPPVADGTLQVDAADTLTVSYADADSGAGPALTTAVAAVDCGLPSVLVTAPNGGESLVVGTATMISWSASDNVGVTAVDLEYSQNGPGGPWLPIALGVASSGSHSWPVPAVTTTLAFVRVTARDAAGNASADLSDAAFAIAFPAPTATALTPATVATAGGEIVAISGSNFRAGAVVRFGSRVATGGGDQTPLSVTPKLVRVLTPPHLGGNFDVSVVNPDGKLATLADAVTFRSFDDVPSADGFFPYIEAIRWEGVTGGCSAVPPLYCPANLVTRAQMAVFLVRALGALPNAGGAQAFTDVPPADPFYGYVQTFATLGITGGCGGGKFCPGDAVTREQMAVFLLKSIAALPDPSLPALFSDVPPGSPYYGFVQRLAKLGITGGCAVGRYCPSSPVTRGQMAVFLTRTFGFASAIEEAPPRTRAGR